MFGKRAKPKGGEKKITASAKLQENFNPNLKTNGTIKIFFPHLLVIFYPLERK